MSEAGIRVKFCPQCRTERPISEFVCQGQLAGGTCGWMLLNEPEQEPGRRSPEPLVHAAPTRGAESLACPNGHPVEPGDQMCTVCGLDVPSLATIDKRSETDAARRTPAVGPLAARPTDAPTDIEGWRLERVLPTDGKPWSRYVVRDAAGRDGVLTLYNLGSEPDPAVHEVLRRMDRDHLPELYTTGRWQDRAYEVTELVIGSSLRNAGYLAAESPNVMRRIADELGRALASFQELGLRHRDLNPDTILLRSQDPLDLVITGFGSARLSDFDLDAVAPLELTRYSSPEAIVGGVSAASDWWSLGVILLEQLTRGTCFAGVNDRALHIHVVTRGISVPEEIETGARTLLRGLLARDPLNRWQWPQVRAWLAGELVDAPSDLPHGYDESSGPAVRLGGRSYRRPEGYALAAAEAPQWEEARSLFLRGSLATWLEERGGDGTLLASVRRLQSEAELGEDLRHGLALMALNPSLPLTMAGEIVAPAWLLAHPQLGYEIITGAVARHLERMGREAWIVRLRVRAEAVRERARVLEVALDEDRVRVMLLASSRSNLEAERTARRKVYPHSEHAGVAALLEHERLTDEELIILVSATLDHFVPLEEVLNSAADLARQAGVAGFDSRAAGALLARSRRELYAQVEERTGGFARSSFPRVNEWADAFRVERRMSLARAAVLLAVPQNAWQEPPKQSYISDLLGHFEKRVARAVQRGPLVRFTIGKTTPRVDLFEFGTRAQPAEAILDHLLRRTDVPLRLDPSAVATKVELLARLRRLVSHALTFRRDTGIDGRYLGFPFLVARDDRLVSSSSKPRIVPVLLWPVNIEVSSGAIATPVLAFDREREEVRLNPAIDGLLGPDEVQRWFRARDDLLMRTSIRAVDVMDIFGTLAAPAGRQLAAVPGRDVRVTGGPRALHCAAALFNAEFTGQAIAEDLRRLKGRPVVGTSLAAALRMPSDLASVAVPGVVTPSGSRERESPRNGGQRAEDLYLTVESDPSQESAVLMARVAPGLLVEGPPGTGKSQTIVNIIADSIGRRQSVLVVCQKQAALQVVQKRLEAEGLRDRLFAVTDVNKDRHQIIQALRTQLDHLRTAPRSGLRAARQEREALLARLTSLEDELNSHHESTRAIDETTGLSYRAILNELIAFARHVTPAALPVLRPWLSGLRRDRFAEHEETVVSLAPLWLRARYEGSPLSVMRQFSADDAVVDALQEGLAAFASAESRRDEVQREYRSSFEIGDPAPYIAWIEQRDRLFLSAGDTTFANAGRWTDFFLSTTDTAPNGPRLIADLERTVATATQLNEFGYEPRLLTTAAALSTDDLAHWLREAVHVTEAVSFWGSLSVPRWIRRRRYGTWLTGLGGDPSEARMRAMRSALTLEGKLRPVRRTVQSIRQTLLLAVGPRLTTPQEIGAEASALLEALRPVQSLVRAAQEFPLPGLLVNVLQKGQRDAYAAFRRDLDAAFVRQGARVASLASLQGLVPWFEPAWVGARSVNIDGAQPPIGGLEEIREALSSLEAFQQFRARASQLTADDLRIFAALQTRRPTLEALAHHDVGPVVRRTLVREALLGWKERLEREHPMLQLQREEIEQKVRRLAEIEASLRIQNRAILAGDIDTTSLGTSGAWEDVTRLRGPRALRLREIIERGADLGLLRLRPVWLVNPDTASRLLPLRATFFDLVIFDEASQMLIEHATPALFRAGRVVVSGDDKQMPPTSFFRGRADSDEEEEFDGSDIEDDVSETEREIFEETWNRREIKDCPDLLALASGCLPRTTLQIHYRSKYRELIAFSNAAFYHARLSVPARHPDAEIQRVKPVEVVRADGIYTAQTNPNEADRVVGVLTQLWAASPSACPSVGVVTFNRKQADLIEERVEARAASDPAFLAAYTRERDRTKDGEDMGFFVKNVENVQGDERDVIVFSTTFGRDRAGAFRRFFGVLGQTGGERRLNVAITRAREKVILVTSMPISDISDMLAVNRRPDRPRDYLQAYLDYATKMSSGDLDVARKATERLMSQHAERPVTDASDAFVDAVAEFVSGLGYEPVRGNDGDTFGVDLAVVDRRTGQFGLAIECDAPWDRQGHLRTARARELWRPAVIRRAIPATHRVWSQAWFRATADEQRRLTDALEAALS